MKAIFLDIDGVLNSEAFFKKAFLKKLVPIDEKSLKCLKYLIDETKAVIVLSSTWRLSFEKDENNLFYSKTDRGKELLNLLKKYNLSLYGLTPHINSWRENEIKKYLDNHPEIDDYIIFDDDEFDLQTLKDHLIKVNRNIGLNMDYVNMGIEILNNQKKLTYKK